MQARTRKSLLFSASTTSTKSFKIRKELTVRTLDDKIALDVRIEICMTRIVCVQNKLLDSMSLKKKKIISTLPSTKMFKQSHG
jgi:hypothetical protein